MIPEQTLLGFPLFGDNATKVEPDNNKKSNGWQQGDVVPAEWMNWEWYHASKGVADLNKGVSSMEKEINAVLASFGITPAELTNNQLLTAMRLNASFVSASSTTITGPLLVSGGTIRVMFTDDLAGSDTTTGLTLTYNGQNIPVKVSKNGVLRDFCANEIATNEFKYLQKYTTLELFYDSIQFIIIGNPIVLSAEDYTIYADGYSMNIVIHDNQTFQSQTASRVDMTNHVSYGKLHIAVVNAMAVTHSNVGTLNGVRLVDDCGYRPVKSMPWVATNFQGASAFNGRISIDYSGAITLTESLGAISGGNNIYATIIWIES